MTITASNYFEQVDTFINKLPAAVKEAHDLVTSLKNDGIENPFKTGDKDIDEVGAKLLEQANKVLQSTGPTAKPAAKKSKATKKRNTDILKKYMFDERHPLMLIDKGTSQWNEAYDEFVEYIKLNPQGKPGEFELITKAAKKPTQINTDSTEKKKTVRKTVRKKSVKSVKSVAKKTTRKKVQRKSAQSAAKKSMPVKKAKRMAQKVATKAVKQARKADAKKAPVTVKKLSLELQLIKQVAGMAGKTYTIDALRKKALTIKNHMAEGRIHDHVTTIKQLLTAFNKLIDTAVDMKADKVKVTISKGKQTELSALVKNATVRVRTEFLAGAGDKVVLTFLRVDPDTGNIIYRGSDKDNYVSVEGTIHDMTDEGEPLAPVKNVIIKEGEPVYDPKDRFARRLTNLSGPKKKSVQSVAKKTTRKKVQRKSAAKKRTTKKA